MSLLIAPYNNAMRLGQGFNTYTQQICVDDAVVVDPDRAENVVTNDGTTMRIMAQMSSRPSAWSRQKEVVTDKTASEALKRIQSENQAEAAKKDTVPVHPRSDSNGNDLAIIDHTETEPLVREPPAPQPPADVKGDKSPVAAVFFDEAEVLRLREQRLLREQLDRENREEERQRRYEDRIEQRQIRQQEREWQAQRRNEARKAVADASKAKAAALTLDDLAKIRAQNQFVERFSGMSDDKEKYVYDTTAAKGPSQTVTYSSKFIDRLSDITDDMSISGALSIKAARIGGSGRGSFVDSDKFKDSDLKFYISVKVVNQTVNFKDALVYNGMRNIKGEDFVKVFGDSFISGFVEGGEFNALVSMKVLNKAKMTDIKAEAKVALTAGPVDITAEANVGIARSNLETNTETTIQVSWCGGGHIKPMEQPWTIESIMQAAARFPDLVAECPQRTYAILTKYESLRSFMMHKPESYTALQYENAQIYTNALMDAFMTYKSMYKKLGEQMVSIQGKTLELVPWDENDEQQTPTDEPAGKTERFADSIKGLSDARTAMRKQMMYIVNEVDLIENDPKAATNEDHQEPFQSPATFETRLPEIKVPNRLQRSAQPLGGRRFIAKTQTEQEFDAQAKAEQEAEQRPLYDNAADLSQSERDLLDNELVKNPTLGSILRVSQPLGGTEKGQEFNNIEVLQTDWRATTISIEVSRGAITYVEVEYDNGLLLRKGKAGVGSFKLYRLTDFQPGERITSAAIECGSVQDKTDGLRITALRLFTNRGRRMLAQASVNNVRGEKVEKDGVLYEQMKTLHLDNPLITGTFKGFFGRVDDEKPGAGLLRLGLVWGSTQYEKSPQVKETKAVDYEEPINESALQDIKDALAQKSRELENVKKTASDEKDDANAALDKLRTQLVDMQRLQQRVNEMDAPPAVTFAQAGVLMPSTWSAATASTPKQGQVEFQPRYKNVPRLITGLATFEQPTPTDIAFSMNAHSITNTGFSASFIGRDGTNMAAPKMSWLTLPENDIKFQYGYYDTDGIPDISTRSLNQSIRNRQYYAMPFKNNPTTTTWLCNMSFSNRWHCLKVDADSTSTKEYLDTSIASWAERPFNGARIGWLAWDDTGSKAKIHRVRHRVTRTERWKTMNVDLTSVGFTRPPAVFASYCEIDCGNTRPMRLSIEVKEITATSYQLAFGSLGGDAKISVSLGLIPQLVDKENDMDHADVVCIAIE